MSGTDPSAGRDDDGRDAALPRAIGTWRRAYALVIAALAANIALLWLLGRVYG